MKVDVHNPQILEQILWMRVDTCPNNGAGACDFVHTCVTYETDDNGRVYTKERG